MGIAKTDIPMFSKVQSLGARFFEKFVSTKAMNKKLTEMNDIGLVDLITATNVSQTIDFGSLKQNDRVVRIPAVAGGSQFVIIATDGDLSVAAVVGDLYVVLRPSM